MHGAYSSFKRFLKDLLLSHKQILCKSLCSALCVVFSLASSQAATSIPALDDLVTLFQHNDPARALSVLNELAAQNDPRAQYNLGAVYEWGLLRNVLPISQRVGKDKLWRSKAAEGRDLKKAAEWYLKAAKQGLPEAMARMGLFYEYGKGVTADHKNAMSWYLRAAEAGYPKAMYRLGHAFAYPSNGRESDTRALRWFRRASDLDYAPAQYALAFMLDHGRGAAVDPAQATRLYQRAADQGLIEARFSLGARYELGLGAPHDLHAAAHWYRLAALQGHIGAQKRLFYLLARHHDIQAIDEPLLAWLQMRSMEGDPDACYLLALSYRSGWGIAKERELAANWLLAALQAGFPDAQGQLAATVLLQESITAGLSSKTAP